MNNGNKKKYEQLGVPFGTASAKLRKALIFKMVQRLNEDVCYRCGEKIDSIDNFSIDHKTDWLDSKNPVELFFDLDNIAFSHLTCNKPRSRKGILSKPELRTNDGKRICKFCGKTEEEVNFSINEYICNPCVWGNRMNKSHAPRSK